MTFNVVGGPVGPLYPGAPASPVEYAVTNFGSSPVHLGSVATSITGTSVAGCNAAWFTIYGTQPHTLNMTFPTGTTIVTNTGTTIALTTKPFTQDTCQNATVTLTFSGAK